MLADPDLGVWAFRYDASQPPGAPELSGGSCPSSAPLWVYTPATNRWEQQQPATADGGTLPSFTDTMQAGYDPRSNAVIFANDTPWAYRYRP